MTASTSDLVLRRAVSSHKPVSRDETQAKLDVRSRAAVQVKPGDLYTVADRIEEKAVSHAGNDFIIFHDKNAIHRFSICHATAAVRLLLLMQKKIISTAIITK